VAERSGESGMRLTEVGLAPIADMIEPWRGKCDEFEEVGQTLV
jgi:hypothetical protein